MDRLSFKLFNCINFLLCFVMEHAELLFFQIGARSFSRKSLHHIGETLNPYEQAISIIGKTLAAFDEDNLIPCFGFGDGMLESTLDVLLINIVWLNLG